MSDDPKGGPIARKAAMLCQRASFRLYLDRALSAKHGVAIEDGTHTEEDARDFFLETCGVSSRAELDHNPEAATKFRRIDQHYQRWMGRMQRRQPAEAAQ